MNATGTLNGTIAIVPIPLAEARKLIPSQYRILEHAYHYLLPSFPKDMYPAFMQATHDHEVQAFGYHIPDFSRTGLEFPFLDFLGDNMTSFKWVPSLLMSAGHEVALKGAADYGIKTIPADFEPACNAYRAMPEAEEAGSTYYGAHSAQDDASFITTVFAPTAKPMYSMKFFQNVTNQPTFADGKTCNQMIRLFNTSVSISPNTIENVSGTVKTNLFPLENEQEWNDVLGLRGDTAFIENNYLPCEDFRGYGESD